MHLTNLENLSSADHAGQLTNPNRIPLTQFRNEEVGGLEEAHLRYFP